MNYDKTSKLSNSLIQHGDYSDRVYLMKLSENDNKQDVIESVIDLAHKNDYGKVFAKIKAKDSKLLERYDFECEARIPDFFNGEEDSEFHSLFLNRDRKQDNYQVIRENLDLAIQKKNRAVNKENIDIIELNKDNVSDITKLYSEVFKTYPFPIFEKDFIIDCLESHVRIFGVVEAGKVVALSSCEIDYDSKNVEMTDFATLPSHRTKGLAQALLIHMAEEMRKAGIKTAYTIARALSPGMNITFSKCGYEYGGTLKKNTNISGGIQSMNVWYKNLIA